MPLWVILYDYNIISYEFFCWVVAVDRESYDIKR